MCNILVLPRDTMPVKSQFWNMCYNNWHSYGLVTMIDNKLDIVKKVPESGEIDPEEIWKLLEKDIEFPRILHVRHNTAGATTLDNCHPFDVFYQNRADGSEKHVLFMHNGTMYEYKSKKQQGNQMVDDDSGPSDTQNFVNRVLIPYTSACDFGNGRGDIQNGAYKGLVRKFFPMNNRGIVIANDQEPLILGDWKKIKAEDGTEILSANDDYFKEVIRGPEKTRRDEIAKKAKEADSKKSVVPFQGSNNRTVVPLSEFDFKKQHGVYELKESLVNILDDWDIWNRDTAVALGAATREELFDLTKMKESDLVMLLDWIFSDYASTYADLLDAEDRHHKASKRIGELVEELKDARRALQEAGVYKKDAA